MFRKLLVRQVSSKVPQSLATTHVPLTSSVPSSEQLLRVWFLASIASSLVTVAGEVSLMMKNHARNAISIKSSIETAPITLNLVFLFLS